jgi:hypothetical protein
MDRSTRVASVRGASRPAAAIVLATLAALILGLAAPAGALAAPHVAGVTVLSSTSVKVVFDSAVTNPSATALGDYGIAPDLPVTAASLTDGGHSVVLTTASQVNGQTYTATADHVAGAGGVMPSPDSGSFIGTVQGPDSATSGHDDFNRPSGLSTGDAPVPGPWSSFEISSLNALSLTAGPVFAGAGALDSYVSDTDPALDNALVRYQLARRDEYWLSAYLYVPSGQGWGNQQEIGLIRLMETLETSMARVSAISESSAAHFGLDINWKSTGNTYLATPPVIATDVPFDSWQWIEMHVRQAGPGDPGEIQVWLDGRQIYAQHSTYVYPAGMTYAQTGIMHLVTMGPAAHVFVDEARFGDAYQLPSSRADATAPTVSLTSPAQGASLDTSLSLQASASDNVAVQRVEFFVDGAAVGSDDLAPYAVSYDPSGLGDGAHTIAAVAYDTSGLRSAAASVRVAKGAPGVVAVTAPAAGASWQAGSAQALSWTLDRAVTSGSFKVTAGDVASGATTTLLTAPVVPGRRDYSASAAVSLAPGSYDLTASYLDAGGTPLVSSAPVRISVHAPPAVEAVRPASGRSGAQVQVSGSGFTGASRVAFNGVPAEFTVVSDGLITATVPGAASSGRITVTTLSGDVMSPARFTVKARIAKLSPSSGRRGAVVVLNGTGFGLRRGASYVKFGALKARAYLSWSSRRIACKVPASAGLGRRDVVVVTGSGSSNTMTFRVKR